MTVDEMSYKVLTVRSVDQDMTQDRAKWNQVILFQIHSNHSVTGFSSQPSLVHILNQNLEKIPITLQTSP